MKKFIAVLFMIVIFAFPVSASEFYDREPTFSPYYAGVLKSSVLNEALRELNYIRGLIGVPNNVTLNADYNNKAQHGAVLLDAINTLSHTPGRPSDMSQSFYQLAYDAASHGNLSYAWKSINGRGMGDMTLIKSLRQCMDDSDSGNISRVGHRRWLMNPRMKSVGFGLSTRRGYAVTYVIEEFGKSGTLSQQEYQQYLRWKSWPIADEFIAWPSSKNPHPLSYFGKDTAWCVVLNGDVFDQCRNVRVKLTRQSDGRTWNFGGSSSSGFFTVAPNNVAYDECIIFRPNNMTYNNGDAFTVEVTGLTRRNGRTGSISYSVKFTGTSSGAKQTSSFTPIRLPQPPKEDIQNIRKSSRKRRVVR